MFAYNGLENKNEKNCFINSILQSFAHLAPVREFLLSKTYRHNCISPCLSCEITTVLIGILYSTSSISTQFIRAALVNSSNSNLFFYNERGCVIETYEYLLAFYHSLHIKDAVLQTTETGNEENIGENDTCQMDCERKCFGHENFGFLTKMIGKCCSREYCQESVLNSLNVCGESFVEHFKAFGVEAGLEMVLSSVVGAGFNDSFYQKCACGEEFLVKRCIFTFPKILTISILWNNPDLTDSHIFLPLINSQIDLSKILPYTEAVISSIYKFKGCIFFSRFFKHYMSVFFDESKMEWTYFSDTKTIGSKHWKLIVTGLKIFQVTPVMLFYEKIE